MAHALRMYQSFKSSLEGGEEMKKFAIALAIVLGLNLVSSIISLSAPVSYADEDPQPKPDKPGD